MTASVNPARRHIRPGGLPHFFCPGCGSGQVLNFFLKAVDELNLSLDNMVTIGGVGCTARIPVYLNADTLHGVHGRTLAWATGMKLHNPELKVVVFAGDGDAASIGGNHFIHAARRNLDVTMILVNNLNFAMTGGQVAPTTPLQSTTTTTPYGSSEPPFDICRLAAAAGATYVSRWTTNRAHQAVRAIKAALSHRGFSLVEIISQCPTHFGRYALGSGKAADLLNWIEERSVTLAQAEKLSDGERAERFVLGEFIKMERPVFAGSTIYEVGR
ncbi:MAG: 2-oxoacid:ferredoxin oxidoreductase subunit beta [Firmicutes bacterium]|nr:2-oxoacid:ferredoxin oxidoreductase subunit beta [Bacillota bacterium]